MALGKVNPATRLQARIAFPFCGWTPNPALPSPCGGSAVTDTRFPRVSGTPCTRRACLPGPECSTYHVLLLPQRRVQMQQVFQVKVVDTQVEVHAEKSKEKQKRLSEYLMWGVRLPSYQYILAG